MNPDLEKLIPAIISRVRRSGGYVSKTKLLKLLYLFDVEFYRVHRETFTQFDWIYYHLGPWTREYDPLLERLAQREALIPSPGTHPDFDSTLFKTAEDVRLFGLLPREDEAILRRVLNVWGEKSTPEILNYVYFQTEPVEQGERDQRLDFSLIPTGPLPKYTRAVSPESPQEIQRIKNEFKMRVRGLSDELEPLAFRPKYDDAFFDALAKLENDR